MHNAEAGTFKIGLVWKGNLKATNSLSPNIQPTLYTQPTLSGNARENENFVRDVESANEKFLK